MAFLRSPPLAGPCWRLDGRAIMPVHSEERGNGGRLLVLPRLPSQLFQAPNDSCIKRWPDTPPMFIKRHNSVGCEALPAHALTQSTLQISASSNAPKLNFPVSRQTTCTERARPWAIYQESTEWRLTRVATHISNYLYKRTMTCEYPTKSPYWRFS